MTQIQCFIQIITLKDDLVFQFLVIKLLIMKTERMRLNTDINPEQINQTESNLQNQQFTYSQRSSNNFKQIQFKEVLYQNRIFNVKKKFTVQMGEIDFRNIKDKLKVDQQTQTLFKHSELFSKHIDVIQKNKALLRRGVCEIPLQPLNRQYSANKRYKTDEVEVQSEILVQKKRLRTSTEKTKQSFRNVGRFSWQKNKRQDTQDTQLPNLQTRSKYEQIQIPIKQKTISSFNQKLLSEKQQFNKLRNAIKRKLDIQVINNRLLAKWSLTTLKL